MGIRRFAALSCLIHLCPLSELYACVGEISLLFPQEALVSSHKSLSLYTRQEVRWLLSVLKIYTSFNDVDDSKKMENSHSVCCNMVKVHFSF